MSSCSSTALLYANGTQERSAAWSRTTCARAGSARLLQSCAPPLKRPIFRWFLIWSERYVPPESAYTTSGISGQPHPKRPPRKSYQVHDTWYIPADLYLSTSPYCSAVHQVHISVDAIMPFRITADLCGYTSKYTHTTAHNTWYELSHPSL